MRCEILRITVVLLGRLILQVYNISSCDHSSCGEVCGNGVITSGEGCDDGNSADGDGCSSACTIECGYDCSLAQCLAGSYEDETGTCEKCVAGKFHRHNITDCKFPPFVSCVGTVVRRRDADAAPISFSKKLLSRVLCCARRKLGEKLQ